MIGKGTMTRSPRGLLEGGTYDAVLLWKDGFDGVGGPVTPNVSWYLTNATQEWAFYMWLERTYGAPSPEP